MNLAGLPQSGREMNHLGSRAISKKSASGILREPSRTYNDRS